MAVGGASLPGGLAVWGDWLWGSVSLGGWVVGVGLSWEMECSYPRRD